MNSEPVDLKLIDTGTFYDLAIADNGDLASTDGLETSLIVSFFTDRRADSSEVRSPQYQRGWWGTTLNATSDPELGSKIWLLDQAVSNESTVNSAIAYTQDAYSWITTDDFADSVQVTASRNNSTLAIFIKIIKNNDIISEKVYNLWLNTVDEINNA